MIINDQERCQECCQECSLSNTTAALVFAPRATVAVLVGLLVGYIFWTTLEGDSIAFQILANVGFLANVKSTGFTLCGREAIDEAHQELCAGLSKSVQPSIELVALLAQAAVLRRLHSEASVVIAVGVIEERKRDVFGGGPDDLMKLVLRVVLDGHTV